MKQISVSGSADVPRRTRDARRRIFVVLNPLMRFLLRLPWSTPLQDRLLLLTYVGRKSGRRHTLPISYMEEPDGCLVAPGGGAWKWNLGDGRPAELLYRGRRVTASTTIIADRGEIERLLPAMIASNPRAEAFIGVPIRADGRPDPTRLGAALQDGFRIVRLRPVSEAPPDRGMDRGDGNGSVRQLAPIDRLLALGGVLGPVVFVITVTLAGLLRPGYSPVDQTVSDLGIGDHAWIVNGAVALLGLALVGFAIAFYRNVRPDADVRARLVTAALLASVGVSFALAGAFPETDPRHYVAALLFFVSAPLALASAGILLRGAPALRGWARATLAIAGLTVALTAVTFYVFSFYRPSSGPEMIGRLGGLMERVVFVVVLAWYAAYSLALLRRGA